MTPLFSILHSSARPEKWREIYDAWIKAAVNPEQVEYVLCVDERWGFVKPFAGLEHPDTTPVHSGFRLVWNTSRRCYVDGVNTAAKASTGRILIVNADDQYPCEGWDAQLLSAVHDHKAPDDWTAAEFVIEVSTGTPQEHDRGILPMPILSRARYERLGYALYPEYESMWADNDFCEAAKQDGVIIDARHLLFPHRHPLFDHSARKPGVHWKDTDPQYAAQNRQAAWLLGAPVFQRRKSEKFAVNPMKGGTEGNTSQSRIPLGAVLAARPNLSVETNRPDATETNSVRSDVEPPDVPGGFNWLQKAESIQGWMSTDELKWLHSTASQMNSVAEIGCWKGRSTYALLSGCKGNVYAIDHFKGSDEPEHRELIAQLEGRELSLYATFLDNVGKFPTLIPVRYSSEQAAKIVPSVDFVFIDGSHDYESVKIDLLTWKDKAQRIIAGHDLNYPDVARAVAEVLGPVQRAADTDIWFKPVNVERRIVLCLPGEQFRREWNRRMFQNVLWLHTQGFLIAFADEYTNDVAITRELILEQVQEKEQLGLTDNDLLLWVDDDNPLAVEDLELLLSDLDARPDIGGVCGWCWIQADNKTEFQVSCGEFTPDKLHWNHFNPRTFPKERAPRVMECGGFPCVLMRYGSLKKILAKVPHPFLQRSDPRFRFGKCGEDMAFWLAADEAGVQFLVDPRCHVPHFRYSQVEPVFPEENAPVHNIACMMRVKNEARWIQKSIESVKELCGDRIYVMEDGSTDGTPELIEAAGAHLVHSPYAGLPLDERRDKQWLLEYVKQQCSPDWILMIDGDEALEPNGTEKLRQVIRGNPRSDILALRVVNLWDSFDQARVDGVYGTMCRQSLFRPLPDFEFKSYYEGKLGHNHVGLHTSNAPFSQEAQPINVFLLHFGYVYKDDRIRKYRWITQLDPENEIEDFYRHTVLGDLPEFPKDLRCKHGGPVELRKIPRRMITRFEKEPGPAKVSGSACRHVFGTNRGPCMICGEPSFGERLIQDAEVEA